MNTLPEAKMPEAKMPEETSLAFKTFFDPALDQSGMSYPAPPEGGVLFEAPGYPGGKASGLKIFAIANDQYACGNLRVRYPLMNLAAMGAQVKVALLTSETPIRLIDMQEANVILVQRWGDERVAQAVVFTNEISI